LAALSPLGHALQAFERVKAITLEWAIADLQSLREQTILIKLEVGPTIGHRDRRAGHERHEQLARPVVHPLRVLPRRGQVLVAEDGNGLFRLREDLCHLIEESAARV